MDEYVMDMITVSTKPADDKIRHKDWEWENLRARYAWFCNGYELLRGGFLALGAINFRMFSPSTPAPLIGPGYIQAGARATAHGTCLDNVHTECFLLLDQCKDQPPSLQGECYSNTIPKCVIHQIGQCTASHLCDTLEEWNYRD
jgi:hypothetical protein